VLSRTNSPPRSTPNSFRFRTSANPCILHYFGANKSFRIRTYRPLSCNPFRMHTYKNTGGGGVAAKLRALLRFCSKSITFKRLQPLCPLSPTPILCFQQLRASFCKTPGWGLPNTPAPSFVPPSHAPRGASIPCAVSRLRILPVTAGVYYPSRVSDFSAVAPHPIASPFVFIFLRIAFPATPFLSQPSALPGGGGCR
jgi:hypothetical protein